MLHISCPVYIYFFFVYDIVVLLYYGQFYEHCDRIEICCMHSILLLTLSKRLDKKEINLYFELLSIKLCFEKKEKFLSSELSKIHILNS